MYKKQSKSISFEDFNQPMGMTMSPDNRWVKKVELIPWDEIEKEYAKLFRGIKGKVAKSARLALGALLIQIEYGYSDAETVEQIKENPYLQFFCGLPGYHYCRPFDASTMVRFRKSMPCIILKRARNLISIGSKLVKITYCWPETRNQAARK